MKPSIRASRIRIALLRSAVVAGALLLGVSGCAPTTPTPTPATSPSATPTPTSTSASPTPVAGEVDVTAAVVVVTATTTSVFGTDGSTLASVNYDMDGAAAAAEIADALGAEPAVATIAAVGESDGPCPAATSYDFGGLLFRSPGSLGSSGAIEVIVTAATTTGGIGIETIAAQRIGAGRAAFEAAVGEFMPLYEPPHTELGIDIVNPEADEWSRIGVYASFSGGSLAYLAAPHRLGFVGGCA